MRFKEKSILDIKTQYIQAKPTETFQYTHFFLEQNIPKKKKKMKSALRTLNNASKHADILNKDYGKFVVWGQLWL